MSEVTRYSFEQYPHESYIIEDAEGRYVEYKDYAALQEKFDFKQNLTDQVVALQKQCDALAAENAALKSDELQEFLRLVECMNGDHCDGNYGHSHEWIRHIVAQQNEYEEKFGDSPWGVAKGSKYVATEAYLNSVRADSVEDAAKRLFGQGYTFEVLTRFASKLRAGEPS